MKSRKCVTPNFEEDIFINYGRDDNEALISTYRGWIDTMHESLLKRLTQLIGERPAIWRDIMMGGNEMLNDTIVLRLEKTAFLVSVLSPSYVNSKWCKLELNEFYKRAAENGGVKINNRSRIFKVMKTPIGNDSSVDPLEGTDLPHELRRLLQESLGYEFYETDNMSGKLREFWPELGPEYLKKFLDRLEDLAQDIKTFIKAQQAVPSDPSYANNIYLAETTPELSGERNEIKRTLQQHNYRVLPDENLPFEDSAFEEKVKGYLEQSILSIHLIGSDHTVIPAEEQLRSQLELKYRLAAERVSRQHELALSHGYNNSQYSRLIWIPEGLTAQEKNYQEFLAYLQNDPGVYEGAEVLCGVKLEDLKTIIQKKLKYRRKEEMGGDGRRKRVYLVCDKLDLQAVTPLRSYLEQERQYEVLLPFEEGSEVVSGRDDNLRICDALLIFYGAADTVDYKLKDLRRVGVIRDNKPLLAKGIYVGGPETEQKKSFHTEEATVMKNFGDFSPKSIEPLLKQIEQSQGQ